MEPVKVYAVIAGWDYEGTCFDSLRLFDCKSTAEAYQQELQKDFTYDYTLMETRTVCMDSALAA